MDLQRPASGLGQAYGVTASRPLFGFEVLISPDAKTSDLAAALDSFVIAAYTDTGKAFIRIPLQILYLFCGRTLDFTKSGYFATGPLRFAMEVRGPESGDDGPLNPHCRMPWYTECPFDLRVVEQSSGDVLAGWHFAGDSIEPAQSPVNHQATPEQRTGSHESVVTR